MRTLLWTLFGTFIVFGFVSLVVAGEGDSLPEAPLDSDAVADMDGGVADVDGGVADVDGGVDAPSDDAGALEPEPVAVTEPVPVPEAPALRPVAAEEAAALAAPEVALPFGKGSMELALGVGLSGNGDENYFGVAGRYAYYLFDSIAAGLDLRYTHVFVDKNLDYDYPESLTLLPFAKYVISRKPVAPYILAAAGYEFEWGTDGAVNAWILGLGGGVHVAVSKHVRINIELTALHYWYTDTKVYWYHDNALLSVKNDGDVKVLKSDCDRSDGCAPRREGDTIPSNSMVLVDADDNEFVCTDPAICGEETVLSDKPDKDREWFFPLISVGVGFVF